jgi:hypothetical protein
MPRTALPIVTPLGSAPALPLTAGSAAFVFTAADVSSKNAFPCTGRELVLVQNTDSGAHTVTISSVADPQNRTGDITSYSIAAGAYVVLGPFRNLGWQQSDGNVYLEANDATVKFAIVRLPALA